MSKVLRRRRVVLMMTWLVVASIGAVFATANTEPSVEFILSKSLSPEAKLDRLAELNPNLRQEAMSRLSPQEKSTLWRAHYDRWLAPGAGLTEDQRAKVQQAQLLATPDSYAKKAIVPEVTSFCDSTAGVFTERDRILTFMVIGERPKSQISWFTTLSRSIASTVRPAVRSVSNFLVPPVLAGDDGELKCTCSLAHCACTAIGNCDCDDPPCNPGAYICGCNGSSYACTGVCLNCH